MLDSNKEQEVLPTCTLCGQPSYYAYVYGYMRLFQGDFETLDREGALCLVSAQRVVDGVGNPRSGSLLLIFFPRRSSRFFAMKSKVTLWQDEQQLSCSFPLRQFCALLACFVRHTTGGSGRNSSSPFFAI